MAYTKMEDIVQALDIETGDSIFVSSDMTALLWQCMEYEDKVDLNCLINTFIDCLGPEGTLVFPTYNWGFCEGICFDYHKTKCKTGALGIVALQRPDFIRTKHPIYSFAVWGKGQKELYEMQNISSFGLDSPFAYVKQKHFKQIFIDVSYQHCFTYVHHVEERVGSLPYRYHKEFQADYIDEKGTKTNRTYSMFVRDISKDVNVTIDPMEELFIKYGHQKNYLINGIDIKILDLYHADMLIEKDIRENKSRRLCTYKGQEDR